MTSVGEVKAVSGKGLEGDRYFRGEGTWSDHPAGDNQLTLIEKEAIEAAAREYGVKIEAGDARRNIVVEGLALNHLVGREFTLGEVRVRGIRLCEPCRHLEGLTKPGLRRALIHRGGLRAEILDSGVIRTGDVVDHTPVGTAESNE